MMKKVIVITGPTAVGKTALSLKLAFRFDGEIINADASQFRRGLNIGTAKIDWQNQKVKHYLFDFLAADEAFSIRDYQIICRHQIETVAAAGKRPFLVGGSGLYINAVLGDYDLSIPGRNLDFDRRYREFSNKELHTLLQKQDAAAAEYIHPNNRRRVLRALEAAAAGCKVSANRRGRRLIYPALILCLTCDRETLYRRIDERVDTMIKQGWAEEVLALKKAGVDPAALKEIGYAEIDMYIENKMSLDEAKTIIKKKTRRYAKRQMTWFRNQMATRMITVDYNDYDLAVKQAQNYIRNFIGDDKG